MQTVRATTLGRRQFLRAIGVGAAATVVVPLATEPVAAGETGDDKRKSRYRESEHVKTFYQVNRYPR